MGKDEQPRSNEAMQQQLELQLHEQYAINNNANLSSMIAILVSVVAAFGVYGYVYIHSENIFSPDFSTLILPKKSCSGSETYYLDVVVLMVMVLCVILSILKYICIMKGYGQRKEQFIIYAIRYKYYHQHPNEMKPRIYPPKYHPFGKEGADIPQGLFGGMIRIFDFIWLIIFCSLLVKLGLNISSCGGFCSSYPSTTGIFELVCLAIVTIPCFVSNCKYEKKKICEYKILQYNYRQINPRDYENKTSEE